MPKPDPRIAAYIAEISGAAPYVSHSWIILGDLWRKHTKTVVDGLLKDYFDAVRLSRGNNDH